MGGDDHEDEAPSQPELSDPSSDSDPAVPRSETHPTTSDPVLDSGDAGQSGPALDNPPSNPDVATAQDPDVVEGQDPDAPTMAPDDPRHGYLKDHLILAIATDYLMRTVGAQYADAKASVQGAHIKAWRNGHQFPVKREAYLAYFVRTSRNEYFDYLKAEQRERGARKRSKPPPSERRHEPFKVTVAEIEQFYKVRVRGKNDEETLELVYKSMEEDFDAVAADLNISRGAAYKRRERFQAKYGAMWIAAAVILLIVFGGWKMRLLFTPHAPIAKDDEGPVRSPVPVPSVVVSPEEEAVALREDGLAACAAGRRAECEEKLGRAIALVPGLAGDSRVRAALGAPDAGPKQPTSTPSAERAFPPPRPQGAPPVPAEEEPRHMVTDAETGGELPRRTLGKLSDKGPDRGRAARYRREAFAACNAGKWAACLGGLEDAREVDPEGDADARVQGARGKARAGIRGQ